MVDGPIIGSGFDENADKPEYIRGELVGRQIAWLHLPGTVLITDEHDKPIDIQTYSIGSPDLWDALALETADAGKMVIFAAPVQADDPLAKGGPNQAALRTVFLWRWMVPPEVLWGTLEQARHLRGFSNQPVLSEIQRWVHGEIVKDVMIQPEPNSQGGQECRIVLSGGIKLRIGARRRAQALDPNRGEAAAFELHLTRPRIYMPSL